MADFQKFLCEEVMEQNIQDFSISAVKAKRNKGKKNASHGLNPGRRYWCHASDSLTEPSGPAASQRAHIPISLHHEPKFSQDYHQAIPSHPHFSHLDFTERGIARLGTCSFTAVFGPTLQ